MSAPSEVSPSTGLRRRRESQKRKGEDEVMGPDKTDAFAKEELEQLSDDSEAEGGDLMSPDEVIQRRNMVHIRRKAEHMLRVRTLHSMAVLRPYTMGHHIALVEMGEDEHDDLADAAINARARVEAMVVFIFYGSLICTLRIAVILLDLYINTISDHPSWNLFTRQGWYDVVRYSGYVLRKSLVAWWTNNHSVMSMCIKTVIFIIVLQSVYHRVLGWALSEWLYNLIGTPKGAFKMTFGAITLRLGLIYNDNNEIVVSNFVWHNTPRFKQTPYFGKIATLRLKFCLTSLLDAIRYRTPIKVTEFVIDGLTLHIERGKRQVDGLNLWAVLGADSVEDSLQVKEGALEKLAKAASGATSGAKNMGKGVVKGVYSGAKGTASTAYRGVKMVGGVAMQYNPVTMGWQTLRGSKSKHDLPADENTIPEVAVPESTISASGGLIPVEEPIDTDGMEEEHLMVDGEEVEMEVESARRASSKKKKKKQTLVKGISNRIRDSKNAISDLMSDEYDTDSDSDFEYDTSDIEGFQEDMREMETRETIGLVNHSLFQRGSDDQERRRQRAIRNRAREMRNEQRDGGKDVNEFPELEMHWGVPYKFDCKRFTGRNLTFYVKDYLAAKHTKHAPIIIPLMEMDATEVGCFHSSGMFGGKCYSQGLYLDDLIWRVINRLITDLLKTNAFSLLSTVGASGLNQAKNTVIGGAKSVVSTGVESIYNYNPKEFANVAMKTIQRVKSMGAPKLCRSPSVQDLQVENLKVLVGAIRGLNFENQLTTSPVMVKLELCNQPGQSDYKLYQKRTQTYVPESELDDQDRYVYKFGEVHTLENLTTLNAELLVRVFQTGIMGDQHCAEICLPIRDDVSPLIDEASGRVLKENKALMPWEDNDGTHFTTFLPGIREEKSAWYLLYGKDSETICGEILLSMALE